MSFPVVPVPLGHPSFLSSPRVGSLDEIEADVVILGLPYTTPYTMEWSRQPSSAAPDALRVASAGFFRNALKHYDFDFGTDIFDGRDLSIVDVGDVLEQPGAFAQNNEAATAAVTALLNRGAVPIILGGDHAATIPVMRAYRDSGPLCAVHIDAHLDWRDEVNGVHDGLSSPMRRASELPWVTGMAQVGLRGIGSARKKEVEDAEAYGSVRVLASEVHKLGVEAALARVPQADRYYISLDTDSLDPAMAPGVNSPSFGGLNYWQISDLLRGIAAKGKVVGFDVVEIDPAHDLHGRTSQLATRLILNLLGAMAQAGQFDGKGDTR
jgi:agmatinase